MALQEEVMWLCRYRSEVQRLRNVFRSAVAGDVARLKEAVGEYKENTSRLECQKQLLLKQASVLCSMLCCAVLCFGDYKENTSRLECQKQLLLKQASVLCCAVLCWAIALRVQGEQSSGLCCAVLFCAVLCFGYFKENTSRLECQKQLLLKQASVLCSGLCCAVLCCPLEEFKQNTSRLECQKQLLLS